MYEQLCKLLIGSGAALIYTASRPVGSSLEKLADKKGSSFYYEVSINEKVAYELAFTGAVASKRTACIFSTEGLYSALDPLMTSAYMGVVGGFLVIAIRETSEEVTPIGPFSKLPLIVTEDAQALSRAVAFAYEASERHRIPFIIQAAGGAADGAKQKATKGPQEPVYEGRTSATPLGGPSIFTKDPGRWAALPQSRYRLHKELNKKIERIRKEFETYEGNVITHLGAKGFITNRGAHKVPYDAGISTFHVETTFPLPSRSIKRFINGMKTVAFSEGEYPAMELQVRDRKKMEKERPRKSPEPVMREETMYGFQVVRDELGPASSINMAHGITKQEPGKKVLAITHEDDFFHSGMPALVNTIYNGSSYVLLIMTHGRENEISGMLDRWGFHNCRQIGSPSEVERFQDADSLTVLLCKEIV
jgi:TPP-dependent indolepyruvate ferredoxin oxidoreductase alpha subunit